MLKTIWFFKFCFTATTLINLPFANIISIAKAKPACFSKNIYQRSDRKCAPNTNRLFSIYSKPPTPKKIATRNTVKPLREWNKDINLKTKNNSPAHINAPTAISPDEFPNMTFITNGTDQHAITILSTVKLALAAPQNPLPTPSLAALHIRCIDNKTSVLFEFPSIKMSNSKASTEILYSTDNGAEQLLSLSLSKADSILGLWKGKQAVPFTNKVLEKKSLKISIWNAERTEFSYTFDVENLSHAIRNLRNACNW